MDASRTVAAWQMPAGSSLRNCVQRPVMPRTVSGDSSWHVRSRFVSDRPGVPIDEVGGGHPACLYRPAIVLPEQSAPALA